MPFSQNHLHKAPYLSVIIPAYGQEKTIVEDVNRIDSALKKTRYTYEIILVIDGKKNHHDHSFELALPLQRKNLQVLGYSTNHGKGYAVRFGMARSAGEVIAFIDSGMEISPNSLSLALEHMQWYNADIIVGSKRHPASKVDYPPLRKLMSLGYQMLVWALFGLRVRDTQVGMKIFKREVMEKVMPRLLVKRYAFDIEILALSHALGFVRIYESPVEFGYSFSSVTSAANLRSIYLMIWDTLAVFYRLNIRRYYSIRNRKSWIIDKNVVLRKNLKVHKA